MRPFKIVESYRHSIGGSVQLNHTEEKKSSTGLPRQRNLFKGGGVLRRPWPCHAFFAFVGLAQSLHQKLLFCLRIDPVHKICLVGLLNRRNRFNGGTPDSPNLFEEHD